MIDDVLLVPLIAALILSILHYYFELYAHHLKRFDIYFISFSSGLFITYIFLSMLPEMVTGRSHIGDYIYFIALWGFVLFHIFEKQVILRINGQYEEAKRLVVVRTAAFFINLFIVGMSLVFFFKVGKVSLGYFSMIPVLFHVVSSSLVVEHLHNRVRESTKGRILSSGSILFGAFIAATVPFPMAVYYGLFAFITGMLLYIVTRDVIPKYRVGRPSWFILGIITYLLIILIERLLFNGTIA